MRRARSAKEGNWAESRVRYQVGPGGECILHAEFGTDPFANAAKKEDPKDAANAVVGLGGGRPGGFFPTEFVISSRHLSKRWSARGFHLLIMNSVPGVFSCGGAFRGRRRGHDSPGKL